jgi:DNA (cytosine-5)-methyltransferase 1
MKIGSLFAGIGGLELGLERSGLGQVIWQVEKDPYCLMVLRKRWPEVQRWHDVKKVSSQCLAPVDILCGGFPCQDISSAGKGSGLAGERSGLWFEFARIIRELAPSWVIVENVASGAKRWVDEVCSELGQQGYETLPIPLSARDVGAPHLRKRIFVVAYSNRKQLRKQSRWSQRKDRTGAGKPWDYGSERFALNTYQGSQSVRAINAEMARVQEYEGISSAWPAAPELCGMDDGIPHRLDRCRALGNAVVPQCAEVIGHCIQILEKPHDEW